MTKDSSPIPNHEFLISPKSTNQWLEANNGFATTESKLTIARDMLANAQELAPNINWEDIKDNYMFAIKDHSRRMTGELAIVYSIAATVGTAARLVEWNMDSPPVVYMSGFHPYWELGKKLDSLNERLQAAAEGKRSFESDELMEKAIAREQAEAGKVGTYRHRLGDALTDYANQNLPNSDEYLNILQNIPYLAHQPSGVPTRTQRQQGFALLKVGDIPGAASLLIPERFRTNY